MKKQHLILAFSLGSLFLSAQNKNEFVNPNENLIAENILPIPKSLNQAIKKYSESRNAGLADIHPNGKDVIAVTRFASTNQLHKISFPMGDRKQITFFDEPVNMASYEPLKGEYLIYSKDIGGNEFGQLFKLDLKTLESKLLTDGGRFPKWRHKMEKRRVGIFLCFNKRNGGDRDIYFMDPLKPEDTKLILEVKGGGWGISDVSEDGKKILIEEYVSANESYLYIYNLDTKKLEPITDRNEKGIVQENASFGKNPDEIWYITDRDNEFNRLATFNLKTKKTSYLTSSIPWNVEGYDVSEDKSKIIFTTNESGINKIYILDTNSNTFSPVKLPIGLVEGTKFTKRRKIFLFYDVDSQFRFGYL
ncbi:TolB family protein [Chryseobacterium wanjuense]